jgi:hypothetical protein
MRKTVVTLKHGIYLLFTEMIAVYLIAFPVHAFQVSSSSTGYVRVATQSSQLAYVAANRAALISTVASAAAVASPASVAVRLVTGPVGWAALGVSVALTLAQMYYQSSDVQAIRTAAGTPGYTASVTGGTVSFPNVSYPEATVQTTALPGCNAADPSYAHDWSIGPFQNTQLFFYQGPSFLGVFLIFGPQIGTAGYYACHRVGQPGTLTAVAGAPTPQQVTNYLTTLPASDPLSVERHVTPAGQGVASIPADTVVTTPVAPTDLVPTVKPAAQVVPTDAVIDPNAPAPVGPQPVTTPSTTTTTTTTTTTNPDGSTTATQSEEPTVLSCSAGHHDQRTFGSVLQEHLTLWQGTGLLSALNLLKTLTWPTAIPTYSLQSSLLGTFTLDFSAWSGLLTALRSLIIALAAFVAYRIIFVGNA